MEQISLCEVHNCGRAAISFGMKKNKKTRSCIEHLPSLLEKRMQVFDIAGYNFISSLQDVEVFEERRTLAEKGRGNLTVLEATYEKQVTAALRSIESAKAKVMKSVEGRFEEMRVVVTKTCEEIKKQLAQLEENFDLFLSSKERDLSPTAKLLCSDLAATPRLVKFGIADVSDSVSAALSESWIIVAADISSTLQFLHQTDKKAAINSVLTEASLLAQKGISEALQFADELIGDDVSFDQVKEQMIERLLKLEKVRTERNWKWLQRSWDWRQRYMIAGESTVEVGEQLASLISCQHGKFSEAEKILRGCYAMVNTARHSVSLSNQICGMYLDSGQNGTAEQLCTWILDTFGNEGLPAELYWTTLLYLTYSQRMQSKNNEANAILEEWKKRDFREVNALAEMLRLLTEGIEADWNGRKQDAEKMILRARRIGISHFPTSPFTALAAFRLTFLGEKSAQEQYRQQALSIYKAVAPKSFPTGVNLYIQGNLLKKAGQVNEAEKCYRQAQSIFDGAAPMSLDAAENLSNLGALLQESKRFSEAESCHRQAQSILDVTAPKSMNAAGNLFNLGVLYKEIKQLSDAESFYRQAQFIYGAVAPNSVEAGINLHNLGKLCYEAKRLIEAKGYYREAQAILEIAAPESVVTANNLYHMGMLFEVPLSMNPRKVRIEAERKVRQAISYYEKSAPIFAQCGEAELKSAVEDRITCLKKAIR